VQAERKNMAQGRRPRADGGKGRRIISGCVAISKGINDCAFSMFDAAAN